MIHGLWAFLLQVQAQTQAQTQAQHGITIEKIGGVLALILSTLAIAAIINRWIRKPWEQPIRDLEKKQGEEMHEIEKRVSRLEDGQENILEKIGEIKEMIKEKNQDDNKRLDKIEIKIDDLGKAVIELVKREK